MMGRLSRFGLVVIGVGVGGCADPSHPECGPQTKAEGGACVADPPSCAPGTRLDPEAGTCEIDTSACPSGTVLIQHQCVDPTAALVVDLAEGPEPNGIGLDPQGGFINQYAYQQSAGTIVLPSQGADGFVVHGCVVPSGERGDVDVYDLAVDAPTLIQITVDGVGGLLATFCTKRAQDSALEYRQWERCAAWFDGDTARRQVFLPGAGNYKLWLGDVRAPIGDRPAGDPGGASCYFATIDHLALPPAIELTSAGANGVIGHGPKVYAVNSDSSLSRVRAAPYPGEYSDEFPNAVLVGERELREFDWTWDGGNEVRGEFVFGGRETARVVVDQVVTNVSEYMGYPAPTYELSLEQFPSIALPTSGGAVDTEVRGSEFYKQVGTYRWKPDYGALNLFHYDVSEPGQLVGLDIRFSVPVQGDLRFQDNTVGAGLFGSHVQFTGMGGFGAAPTTFTDYRGVIRHAAAGRYFFSVFAPRNAIGEPLQVVSAYRVLAPATLSGDVSTGSVPLDPEFASNVLYSEPGSARWQQVNAAGTAMGEIVATLFPSSVAGRLGRLTSVVGEDPPTTDQGSFSPSKLLDSKFSFHDPYDFESRQLRFAEDGSTPAAAAVFGADRLFVQVQAESPGSDPAFEMSFATAPSSANMGSLAGGSGARLTSQRIDGNTVERHYTFSSPPGSLVAIRATARGPLDPVIVVKARDRAEDIIFDAEAAATEDAEVRQDPSGYTAFVVHSASATDGEFDLDVAVTAAHYRRVVGSTVYRDICAGGEQVALEAGLDGYGRPLPPEDEGVSVSPVSTPVGFEFFGRPERELMVSVKGYASFGSAIPQIPSPIECRMEGSQVVCARATSPDYPEPLQMRSIEVGTLPDGVGSVHIAPYWNHLHRMTVCKRLEGERLTIQWIGRRFDDGDYHLRGRVEMQLVLDAADQSIEFVYGPNHVARVSAGGVSGVQDSRGFDAAVSFDPGRYPFPFGSAPVANTSVKFVHP